LPVRAVGTHIPGRPDRPFPPPPRGRPTLLTEGNVAGRALAGLGVALLIALAARRAGSLSTGGAAAATGVGTLAIAAGWRWGALLIAFFVSSTALSRWRRAEKERRVGGVVEKGGERDAVQVLANGGAFAVAALGALLWPSAWPPVAWAAAGAGALAAAAADTWATEVGTLAAGDPRTVLGWRRVPAGTSGAVSLSGTAAMVAGAGFVALCARALGYDASVAWAALGGGVAGAVADTLVGATVQRRRWCDRCAAPTERRIHDCGTPTRAAGGLAGIDNDAVNLLCGVVGAVVAGWWAR
jgi:uncharacterized protein (TIGR00297 family)